MKYDIAQRNDLPRLTELWSACFGDAPSEIEEFWKLFNSITVFVARQEEIVSMLCALPVSYYGIDGEPYTASYLYAVCTDERHRNKGLCAKLMDFAEQRLKKAGCDFTVLVPASEELFAYYQKLGYQTAFYHKEYTVSACGKARIKRIDAAAYQNLRQMQLYAQFISYADEQVRLYDTLYRIETEDMICCAAAQRTGDTLLIKELLPDHAEAAAALATHLGCKQAQVRTEGGCIPFGMAKSLRGLPCPEDGYLGLAFD